MKREGIERIKPSMKGPDSIMSGIQFISQFDIIVDERCHKTIEEPDNYTWKKTNKQMNTTTNPLIRITTV